MHELSCLCTCYLGIGTNTALFFHLYTFAKQLSIACTTRVLSSDKNEFALSGSLPGNSNDMFAEINQELGVQGLCGLQFLFDLISFMFPFEEEARACLYLGEIIVSHLEEVPSLHIKCTLSAHCFFKTAPHVRLQPA